MSRFSQSFFSFLFGAFLGGLGALLIAPESGPHTRRKLSFIADRYLLFIQQLIYSLLYSNSGVDSEAKQAGDSVLERAKEQAEELLSDVDSLIDRIKKQ